MTCSQNTGKLYANGDMQNNGPLKISAELLNMLGCMAEKN